ncbi:hypothetical protein N9D22_06675 [Flavobacteriaceae bacterium]|nr:hypothetical protein [Flavobacteriaceae bacterium]
MKKCLILIFLFISLKSYSQEFSLLEINAKWNAKNSLKIKRLKGIPIKTAWLEQQPKSIRNRIKSVPVLILIKDDRPIYQWVAGIDLKLNITESEFNKIYSKLNKNE